MDEGAKAASAECPRGLGARGTARCCRRTAIPVPDAQTAAHLSSLHTTDHDCACMHHSNGEELKTSSVQVRSRRTPETRQQHDAGSGGYSCTVFQTTVYTEVMSPVKCRVMRMRGGYRRVIGIRLRR